MNGTCEEETNSGISFEYYSDPRYICINTFSEGRLLKVAT